MKAKILVVDDELVCSRCARVLSKEGYEVVTAMDGKKALDLIKSNSFDLVLTDVNLPGANGIEVVESVKKKNTDCDVIIITGYPSVETAVEAMRVGAYDYLQKPINLDELLLLVERCIEKKRLTRELDTERKLRQELEKVNKKLKETQTQLIQSGKLAAIGELAAGVAHEINNPLTAVTMNVAFLLESLKDDEEKLSQLKTIEKETDRAVKIVKQLLTFSRKKKMEERELINIHDIIEETLKPIEHQLALANIEVVKTFAKDLPNIKLNSNQIQQVFLNLINNARDAITANTEESENKLTITTSQSAEDKRFVDIIFKDSGCGISKTNIGKVFDPFFTTKAKEKGTGLGLLVSYQIVKAHEGDIQVESETGKGTTFTVKIPVFNKK